MKKVAISIILAIYNQEKYLADCLNSILIQSLSALEIICVNDGSTDSSLEILQKYREDDDRILVITQENCGTGKARNIGIDQATGEYICFMDPDDYYPNPECLKRLYETAVSKNADIVGGNRFEVENDIVTKYSINFFTKEGFYIYRTNQFLYGHTRFIYRRSLINAYSIYNVDAVRFEEQLFLMKAMTCAEKYYAITDEVYYHRIYERESKNYSLDIIVGMAKSLVECTKYARENDYQVIFKKYLINVPNAIISNSKRITGIMSSELWDLLREFYNIENDWIGGIDGTVWTRDVLEDRLIRANHEEENLIKIISSKKIVIYGAGFAAGIVWKQIKKLGGVTGVIGVAQTQVEKEKEAFGFRVCTINSYLHLEEEITLIIAVVNPDSRAIMKDTAISLGFSNVYEPDIEAIAFNIS